MEDEKLILKQQKRLELDSNDNSSSRSLLKLKLSDSQDFTDTDSIKIEEKKIRRSDDVNINQISKKLKISSQEICNNIGEGSTSSSNESILKCIETLRSENKMFFLKIMQQINDVKHMMDKLQTQIIELKTDVSVDNSANILEKPFTNREEFIEFDKSLEDDTDKINNLKKNFARCGGEDVGNFLKKNLRKLLTDNAAKHFCWSGTTDKMSVKSFNSIVALKDVCFSAIKNSTETVIEYHIKRFFHYARQRIYLSDKSK